jgi:hypothetical protein|nr:MAG TPA: hypothetical protein [Caudoviricetes sp.]
MEEKIITLERQVKRQQKSIYVLFVVAILFQVILISKAYKEKVFLKSVSDKLEIIYEQKVQINHLVESLID